MTKEHKIPEIRITSWMMEEHSTKEGSAQECRINRNSLCKNMQPGGCREVFMVFMSRWLASSHLPSPSSMTLEPPEELAAQSYKSISGTL